MTPTPAESFTRQLQDLFDRLRRLALGENPLGASGVTMPQLSLLDAVAESPGWSMGELAFALGVTPPTISVAVRRLEAMALLQRDPNPRDRRAVQLRLTPKGLAIHKQATLFRRAKMRQVLAGLTMDEAAQLLTLLDRAISSAEGRENSSQ